MGSILILSIQNLHAERIFKGVKLFELRKILPKKGFDRVYLYETGGRGIVGCFDAEPPIKAEVDKLWEIVGEKATSRDRFLTYFANSKSGYAIPIRNAIKFKNVLSPKALSLEKAVFSPPMSFLLIEKAHPLYKLLERARANEMNELSVVLEPIAVGEKPLFIELVTKEIAPKYDDITENFAKALLRTDHLGSDPNGIFTQKKRVLAIRNTRNKLLGFTTLTYKIGGCVKTGPTVLLKKARGVGYGAATRNAIVRLAKKERIRKLYCTCPDNDPVVISYLLKAEFRIEAHLVRQYSETHGELVLGKIVEKKSTVNSRLIRRKAIKAGFLKDKSIEGKNLAHFFCKMFSDTWIPISKTRAKCVLKNAHRTEVSYEEKPIQLLSFGERKKCNAQILLVPKRGGAVKALWLSKTNHKKSLKLMLRCAEDRARKQAKRKIYFVLPWNDEELIRILKENAYLVEGLLNEPYRVGQDAVILSKYDLSFVS